MNNEDKTALDVLVNIACFVVGIVLVGAEAGWGVASGVMLLLMYLKGIKIK